ncbi:MAG: hypothetical protein IPM16_07085 [Chloroflexi bacterium]|nr:hypothetical protein [Chloroflexota bacterium]
MRWLVSVVALLLLAFSAGGQSTADRAEAAYEAGDYARAADLWVLAAEEEARPATYINAGQALLMSDDLGRAMLYFKRAQLEMPRAPEVQLGIALVRSLRVDVYQEDQRILPTLERMTAELVSSAELQWLAVIALTGAGVAWLIHVTRRPRWALAIALTVVACLLVVLMLARAESVRLAPPAVVTALETVLYSRSDAAGFELGRAYAGAEARIEAIDGARALLTFPDGRQGWVDRDAYQPVITAPA